MMLKTMIYLAWIMMACQSASVFDTAPGYKTQIIASGLSGSRSLVFDSNKGLLTIARTLQKIVLIKETFFFSGTFDQVVILDLSNAGLNLTHGLAYRDGYIYASSDVNIWRWAYTPGSQTPLNPDAREWVVRNMGSGGNGGAPLGHTTRTFVFGPDKYLYIGISSLNNIDSDSRRSRVRRLYFPTNDVPGGSAVDFETLEVWADGLRNPLGLDFDPQGRLWETDNGPDNLVRSDLGDIHADNPCDEFNLLSGPANSFYGYPYCFSVGNLTSPFESDPQTLKQLAWPTFINDGVHTDSWCQQVAYNRPPKACIPAHSSPISLRFFKDVDGCGTTSKSFPCSMKGDAFVTLHGSWNRPVPTGFSVIRFPFDPTSHMPTKEIKTLFSNQNVEQNCGPNSMCFRPAGLAFQDGILYVSSDATGEIMRIWVDNSSSCSLLGYPCCKDCSVIPDTSTDYHGYKYGFEDGASCICDLSSPRFTLPSVSSSTLTITATPTASPVPTACNFFGFPCCSSCQSVSLADPNGYQYGWENDATCICESLNTNCSLFGFPCCQFPVVKPAVDPNGYKYGWENGQSCIIVN